MTWRCGTALALALSCIAAAMPAAASAAPAGTVTSFPLPAGSAPAEVTTGPDGNLWITLAGGGINAIGRMTTAGVLTQFPIPTANAVPNQITNGPDGALWFGEFGSPAKIGRITTAGAITEFTLPSGVRAQGLTAGPDGNVWFTSSVTNQLGRITRAGTVTMFSVPGGSTTDVVTGPDGNLWYTGIASNKVGRMTIAGAATEFDVTGSPAGITVGSDGALWFSQTNGGGRIGRITTSGAVTNFQTPTNAPTNSITLGPDGNVWFAENSAGIVGRVTPAGQVSEFPAGFSPLAAMGAGPDEALWIPAPSNDRMVRVDAGIPTPVLGRSFTASPTSGTVLVELPGTGRFVPLADARSLPVGTIVDARKGVVRLYATSGGVTYFADFYEGIFQIAQLAKRGSTADLKLFGGNFKGCPKAARGGAARKKSIRHLWGKGSGPFRTVGRFSAATVRGTTWLTDDQCTGTLTKVTTGSVSVRDLVKKKTVVVRKGKSYFARARR